MAGERVCRHCGLSKPEIDFPKANYGHWCKPCWFAYHKGWIAANLERNRAAKRRWKRKHPEQGRKDSKKRYHRDVGKSRASQRAKYAANPDYFITHTRSWQRKNQAHVQAMDARWKKTPKGIAAKRRSSARRRGIIASTANDLTADEWQETLTSFGYSCAYCLKLLVRDTQDHIVPITAGGAHTKSNVVPACGSCNSKWGNRTDGKMELLQKNWPSLFPRRTVL